MARSLAILCNFIALAHAYTTFHSNCTAPSTSVNFVLSNETRGTIDILWSCLFTIIACTWTVQHLNVPEQRENRDPGRLGDIKWALKRTWTSAKWMLATTLAPEVLLSKNLGDLFDAKADLRELQKLADQDGVPWTITHSLFANMGGFVIRSHVPERFRGQKDAQAGPDISNLDPQLGGTSDVEELERQGQSQPKLSGANPQPVRVSDAMKSEGQGQSEPKSSGPDQPPPNEVHSSTELGIAVSKSRHRNPFFLVASDVLALRQSELLPRLPYLNDKNKSDSLVRLVAVVQIAWMVIQIIVRASRRLAISQLEIAVIAFATCATIMYGLNDRRRGAPIPNHFTRDGPSFSAELLGVTLGSMVFGAVHITHEIHAHKTPAYEVHTHELHACEVHVCEMHACEVHAHVDRGPSW